MTSLAVSADTTKSELAKWISEHLKQDDVFLYFNSTTICNALFAADIFRRRGHVTGIRMDVNGDAFVFISSPVDLFEYQISRQSTYEDVCSDLLEVTEVFVVIRACGTTLRTAWEVHETLLERGWVLQNATLDDIPMRVQTKKIFKTTLLLQYFNTTKK